MNYFNEGNKFYNMQDYLKAIDYYKQSAAKNLNKPAHIIILVFVSLN